MKRLLALLFILAAQPLLGCAVSRFDILPPRPTTTDAVEVVLAGGCPDGCIPFTPRVKVVQGTVTIDLESTGACILIPLPWGERVNVGRLPAGTHTLVVNNNGKELARRSVVVREHPFTILPTFGNEGTEVLIDLPGDSLVKSVTFGGLEGTPGGGDGNQFVVKAPKHGPGLVDVVVTDEQGKTFTAEDAFLYPDLDADLTGEHERVFFPSVYAGGGAHGSLWDSRNVILNTAPLELETIPSLGRPLVPGQRTMLPTSPRDGGLFVMIPRGLENRVSYASHIVDESRRKGDAGTELPVVHESETGALVRLLDVPMTPESRHTLRIFDFDAVPGRIVTIAFDRGDGFQYRIGTVLGTRIVCVRAPCYPEHPTFAVINLDSIRELAGATTVDITVFGASNDIPLWAYVSVTNNDTQHVTAYTPQHRRSPFP